MAKPGRGRFHPPPAPREPWDPPYSLAFRFWSPLAAMAAGIAVAYLFFDSPGEMTAFLVAYYTPFGTFWAIGAAATLDLPPLFVLVFLGYLRILAALFFVWNVVWLRALPRLGPRIMRTEEKGHATWERHPWMRRLGVMGLGLFVFIPLPGTGLVAGALVGRLAGFDWRPTWAALTAGGLIQITALIAAVYTGWRLTPWA